MYGFIIITTAFKNIKGKLTKNDMFCNIKIYINKKNIYIKAILDTGNFLREPITKTPVVVVQKNALVGVVPDYILDNLDRIIKGENMELNEYVSRIRLIPFSSIGRENGLLLGVKADNILIQTDEKNINLNNIIIGIYDGVLNKCGKYQALIGLDLLEDSEGGIENEYIRNIKV